jgi:two-component system alkaline phosphatase synthesis response regulator PhoP
MEPSSSARILVIEDDGHIAEGLRLNLRLLGYQVEVAADGVAGLQRWKSWRPNLIVLDIMLPGIDGLAVLQSIRLEDERVPILILSAKSTAEDRVRGLTHGVDDYLTKPFNLEEFQLRVERLLQRGEWSRTRMTPEAFKLPREYAFGPNRVDFATGTAVGPHGKAPLTEQELKLLKLFIRYRGQPLARGKILEVGWGYSAGVTTRTVDNFIVRLRRYFEVDPKNPQYFKSVRSVGYLFDHPD